MLYRHSVLVGRKADSVPSWGDGNGRSGCLSLHRHRFVGEVVGFEREVEQHIVKRECRGREQSREMMTTTTTSPLALLLKSLVIENHLRI